ncbi:MAG: carbohydrate kinase [Holophagales bacterium]|jgi:sugar/nucleoside kinase (ribokinase family)|nr:carbohydrate kinase [Holophagales bacterium]MBK9965725.1 carbohydrate kinase [Holophagales bacterium]
MPRIVVVGSVSIDEVVTLRQPLRAGAHLDGRERGRRVGGGAANTAIPLAFAGHAVTVVSAVGTDPGGSTILERLSEAGVDPAQVVRRAGSSTRSLVVVEPGGERTVVSLHRCREEGPPRRLRTLPADVIYVRSRDLDLASILAGRLDSALVVAHVPPSGPAVRPAHVLVASAADLADDERLAPWETGRRAAGEPLRWVVVTRGSGGAEAHAADRRFHVPARDVETVDSTGAGDVFAAGLLHALASGAPMESALATAVAWGTCAVECGGIPPRERILALA